MHPTVEECTEGQANHDRPNALKLVCANVERISSGKHGGGCGFWRFLTARIPDDLLKAIRKIERKERAERAEVVQRLLDRAVDDWRTAKALRMIKEGRSTVRRAAKFAGVTYHEILDKMTEIGVDSGPTLKELREGLDRR